MRRTKYLPPYTDTGRTTFPARQRAGVYVIRKAGRLRYIGFSRSDVYKALYRHFQTWNDRSRPDPRIVYRNLGDVTVRVIYTDSAQQAGRLERALIIRFTPPDNPQQLLDYQETEQMRRDMAAAADADWLPTVDVPF
jgi:hypothetical protein